MTARFGPEYDRAVSEHGDRRHAERELERRQERVRRFQLHPLPEHRREHYGEEWRRLQADFVDAPEQAIDGAGRLVTELMQEVGYPVAADFDQRAADLSVDHLHVADNYRAARTLNERRRWEQVQTPFVDEPRGAVERADELVAQVMKRLAGVFVDERAGLEQQWARGDNVSTEDLRLALRRYRWFFDRLLNV
jgi:hypothetical protein